MKGYFNKEKGITLTSLIVTIIIILILAGISVALFWGDDSAVKKAGDAKESTILADIKEKVQNEIAIMEGKNGGEITKAQLKQIFDKYFDQLFRKDYEPQKIQALNELSKCVSAKWTSDNPMQLNESLLAMKSYAQHHHLYTISIFFCAINNMPESVPNPEIAYKKLLDSGLLDMIINMAGECMNVAFALAYTEAVNSGRVFSPQNWIKAKASLQDIRRAVTMQIGTFKLIPDGKPILEKMRSGLKMEAKDFESRWSAD